MLKDNQPDLSLERLLLIKQQLDKLNSKAKIIVVSKNQSLAKIIPLINSKHYIYAENYLQEAQNKWAKIVKLYPQIKLHYIGHLQTNKVAPVIKLFDVIHSLDRKKLALAIAKESKKQAKSIPCLIQVNLTDNLSKSGIALDNLDEFISYCISELKLNIQGLMSMIPPNSDESAYWWLNKLTNKYNFADLSLGMSHDYLLAAKHQATYLRIGSKIFG